MLSKMFGVQVVSEGSVSVKDGKSKSRLCNPACTAPEMRRYTNGWESLLGLWLFINKHIVIQRN